MAKFLFAYRVPRDYAPRPETMTAWTAWFESMGAARVAAGHGVTESSPVGDLGPGTRLGGYSVIDADDLAGATALARTCPAVEFGGGVEIGVIIEGSRGRPAARD